MDKKVLKTDCDDSHKTVNAVKTSTEVYMNCLASYLISVKLLSGRGGFPRLFNRFFINGIQYVDFGALGQHL